MHLGLYTCLVQELLADTDAKVVWKTLYLVLLKDDKGLSPLQWFGVLINWLFSSLDLSSYFWLYSFMFLFFLDVPVCHHCCVPFFRWFCFQMFLLSSVPVFHYSYFQIFLFSSVPVFQCSCFQMFPFSSLPIFQSSCFPLFLFSNVPEFRCSCSPVFQCSCNQLFLISDVPEFRCSCFPVFLYSDVPVFQCS